MKLNIEGVEAKLEDRNFIISSSYPLKVLSSAVYNGGLKKAYSIINHQILREEDIREPKKYVRNLIKNLKLKEPVVALLTGVNMKNIRYSYKSLEGTDIYLFVTSGLTHPACIGDNVNNELSTINIIALINGKLTDGCLVNVVKTLTEAKVYQLKALDIRSKFSKRLATGTTSDAIVIACTNKGERYEYAGSATPLGRTLAEIFQEAFLEATLAQNNIRKDRSLLERLKERGINLEDLIEAGLELYEPKEEVDRREFEEELIKALEDYNVSSLILAGLRLDEDLEEGLIPKLGKEDPLSLVADEALGWALANYLAGTWGIYNFIYYDRNKPKKIRGLGSFTDDVLLGLIAGTLSKIRLRKLD